MNLFMSGGESRSIISPMVIILAIIIAIIVVVKGKGMYKNSKNVKKTAKKVFL